MALLGLAAGATAIVALVVQPWVSPVSSHPPAVDIDRLVADVRMLSVTLHPRSYDDPANLDATARHVTAQFRATGARVESQPVRVEGMAFRNVVARFGPQTGPLLVVGAHYDACRIADAHPDATPGADDNASGIAALLELARMLGRHPPPHPVELVAYTLEEPPFFGTDNMGSAWHARSLRKQGRDVRLMLSLETIGFFSDAPQSQAYPLPAMGHFYGERADYIAVVGRFGDFAATRRVKALMAGAAPLPVKSINAPPLVEGIDFSDHLNYWREGVPAVMITDTAYLRNARYHTAGDTMDRLDFQRMAEVVQGVYAVVQGYETR